MNTPWYSSGADVRAGRLQGWKGADQDRTALTLVGARSFTVAELWQAVSERAEELSTAGLRKGDRLCLMQRNTPDFVIDLLAAFTLGVVVAPLNTALRGDSLTGTIRDLAPCIVRVDSESEVILRKYIAGTDGVRIWPVGRLIEPGCSATPSSVPDAQAVDARADLSDVAVILLTSGTTGLPKGVCWPHEMALTVAEHTTWVMGYTKDDVIYTCLPLFHINGLFCALYAGLLVGAEVVISKRFRASTYWSEIAETRATVTNMMGSIPAILWRRPPEASESVHRVRLGMVLPLPAERKDFESRFGFATTEVYGSTDAGLPLGIPFGQHRPGSCGLPAPGWRADVFDECDRPVAPGVEGELVLRPERPFIGQAGYWRRPETTVQASRNLWFHTGDVVTRDEDGWYYYRGRQKDMIRVSGENVVPILVETALLRHPAVEEAAAYGLPGDLGEEVVAVAVVLREGSASTMAELRRFVEPDLPYFAVPRYLVALTQLPKTQTSKVIKAELQARGITTDHWDGGQPGRAQPAAEST